MTIHEPPCRDWQAHVAAWLAAEPERLGDFLGRFDREREAEEREAVREQATAESELELRYEWGDR